MPRRVLDRSDDVPTGADMTARIPENVFTDWTIVTINAMPPRDPNDDDDAEDEDAESDDDVEPAVVREPDE
jgi:hypothetical protein